MLARRIVPCLDVKDGRVVKGVNFVGLRDAGDPVQCAKRYSDAGADEITFLDITASHEGRSTLLHMVERTASEISVPLTVGGGVRRVEDAHALLRAGADKVAVNSAALQRPALVSELSAAFGAQAIVVAIDAKQSAPGRWAVFSHGGRTQQHDDALAWAKEVDERGAGEILLTSMDGDGTRNGYDIPLTKTICDAVSVPVVASGGVGTLDHIWEAFALAGADAALAASIFHDGIHSIAEVKVHLMAKGICVRPVSARCDPGQHASTGQWSQSATVQDADKARTEDARDGSSGDNPGHMPGTDLRSAAPGVESSASPDGKKL